MELTGTESLTIKEGENQYGHLDWTKLAVVEVCHWIEAENNSVASYEGNVGLHGDGDRIEVQQEGGGSVSFDLSRVADFSSGMYQLYAGVNGTRTRWGVTVDGKEAGTLSASGSGKFEKGTCEDSGLSGEIELSPGSTLRISGDTSGWGHIDYVRLVRTGDATPMFDETDETTGIRVTAPEGILPEGTVIAADTVPRSVRKEIRQQFKETDQKVFFYRFTLKAPGRSRFRKSSEEETGLERMEELEEK